MFKSPVALATLCIISAIGASAQTPASQPIQPPPPAGISMPPVQRELKIDALDQADRRPWTAFREPGRFTIGRWENGYYVTWRSFLNGEKFPEVRQFDSDGKLLREFPVEVGTHATVLSVSATKSGTVLVTGQASQRSPGEGFKLAGNGWHGDFLLIAERGGPIRRIMLGDYTASEVCSNDDKTYWMVAWNNAHRTPILRQIDGDGVLLNAVVDPPNAVNLFLLHHTTALRCTDRRIGLYYSGTWYEYDIAEKDLKHWTLRTYRLRPTGVTFSEAGEVYFSIDEPEAQRANPLSAVLQVASLPARRKPTTLYTALLRLNKDPQKQIAHLEFVSNTLGVWNKDGTASGFTRLVGVDGDELVYMEDGLEGRRLAWGRPQ